MIKITCFFFLVFVCFCEPAACFNFQTFTYNPKKGINKRLQFYNNLSVGLWQPVISGLITLGSISLNDIGINNEKNQ